MTLRSRLTLAFFAISVVPLAAVTFSSVRRLRAGAPAGRRAAGRRTGGGTRAANGIRHGRPRAAHGPRLATALSARRDGIGRPARGRDGSAEPAPVTHAAPDDIARTGGGARRGRPRRHGADAREGGVRRAPVGARRRATASKAAVPAAFVGRAPGSRCPSRPPARPAGHHSWGGRRVVAGHRRGRQEVPVGTDRGRAGRPGGVDAATPGADSPGPVAVFPAATGAGGRAARPPARPRRARPRAPAR